MALFLIWNQYLAALSYIQSFLLQLIEIDLEIDF